jgi:hypothetical protein
METTIQQENKKLSFFKIFIGIILHPRKTWADISNKQNFSYIWSWYVVIAGALTIQIFFVNIFRALPLFIIIHFFFWLTVLIIWLSLIVGLKISGIETSVSFRNFFRLLIYSLVIEPVYLIYFFINKTFFPEIKNPFTIFTTENSINVIEIIFLLIELLFIAWIVIIFIIGVKHVFRISYKRAAASVLIVPVIISFFIFSIILIGIVFN